MCSYINTKRLICYFFLELKANSEEFIPIFANNPRELKAFLEHMIEVDPHSPQGVYDTLLELRLHDWAHEKDPEVSPTHDKVLHDKCKNASAILHLISQVLTSNLQ